MRYVRTDNSSPESTVQRSADSGTRRRIVRRGGPILLVSLLLGVCFLGACDDDPLANAPQGTLRVLVAGHSPTLGNAGELHYSDGNVNLVLPIPVQGMLEQGAPEGTYDVMYVPPVGYVLASGQQANRNVTIVADQVTEISFLVEAAQTPMGLLRVSVSGLPAGAPSGGTAMVERTDVGGQNPTTLNVPGSGTVDLPSVAGTYRVTYTPPLGAELVSGQTNPVTLNVASSSTATATFQVQATPGGGGSGQVLFFSDWRTRTGTTDAAISDGGKWNWMSEGAGQNGSIIDAPAGFSTHKVMRVLTNGYRDGWLAPTVTTLGEIPVGTTRNYRWEFAFHEPALADAGQHPIQDGGSASSSNWYLSTVNGGGNLQSGQWALEWGFWGNSDWNRGEFVLGSREGQWTPLQKGAVYRIELQVVRVSATQFRFHSWIHNASGNLLYDDDDFRSRDGSTSLAQNPLQSLNIPGNSSNFVIGLNGIGNNPPWPIHSSDQAAMAVVQGLPEREQIGPYGSLPGEVRR